MRCQRAEHGARPLRIAFVAIRETSLDQVGSSALRITASVTATITTSPRRHSSETNAAASDFLINGGPCSPHFRCKCLIVINKYPNLNGEAPTEAPRRERQLLDISGLTHIDLEGNRQLLRSTLDVCIP